ncbi:MAG: hypothetical protein VYA86_00825 [Candidatus Thermoplasmatota archaeon]|nr:hypothetical protein [Candidatus Thermoplasmatota archaeon]
MVLQSNTDEWVNLQYLRSNLFIASWALILLAAGISVGVPSSSGLAISAPFGIVGSIMLVWAISMKEEPKGMTMEDISNWTPEADPLPPGAGGSVMYRVDTTLDEPIRTSILCGACGHVEWIEGRKPAAYTCARCEQQLWEEEE